MIAAPTIGTAISIGSTVLGGLAPNPDADRFLKTQGWYRDAIAALPADHPDACRLKYYSGRFGSHDCGTGIISGWATQAAKDYSYLLYNQYLAVRSGQLPRTAPVPDPGQSIPAVANTLATISDVTGIAANTLGAQTVQQQQIQRAADIGKILLLVALVGVGLFVFLRRR